MNLKILITAGVAAAGLLGGTAAIAAPASGASVISNLCPSGAGFNGEQVDASSPALVLSYSTGRLTASKTTSLLGNCMRYAPPAAGHAVPGAFNPKVWQEAPAGHANGSALTLTGGNQLAFTADQDLPSQEWVFNGNDGTWSPATNSHLVLKTNGNGGLVTLAPHAVTPLPSEVLTFVG